MDDTTSPPTYTCVFTQAGAVQPPVGVGVGEPVPVGVGVGEPVEPDGVGLGAGQPAALPLTSVTTSLNSVVPGSRSSSENIMAPPRPLQCM